MSRINRVLLRRREIHSCWILVSYLLLCSLVMLCDLGGTRTETKTVTALPQALPRSSSTQITSSLCHLVWAPRQPIVPWGMADKWRPFFAQTRSPCQLWSVRREDSTIIWPQLEGVPEQLSGIRPPLCLLKGRTLAFPSLL